MHNSIKSISVKQLEKAFATALAELTGKPCTIKISEIIFPENASAKMSDNAGEVGISLSVSRSPEQQSADIPF